MIDTAKQKHKRLGHSVVALYLLTLAVVLIGTAFALYQNWEIRLKATQVDLIRNANISNLLVESALLSASKTLRSTRSQIELAFLKGNRSNEDIHLILMNATRTNDAYSKSFELGLLFFVDEKGLVYALSDRYLSQPIDMSAQYFFKDLLNNFYKRSTVGPLIEAITTRQLVFHMSVPIHDATGKFSGVLAQQILASSIGADLNRSTDSRSFERLMTFYAGNDASFIFPLPDDMQFNSMTTNTNTSSSIKPITQRSQISEETRYLGSAVSTLLALTSQVEIPKSRVRQEFLKDNSLLLAYALSGAVFVSIIFFYLYRLTQRLFIAQTSSMHDTLTGLRNRRSLDEQLPLLLRESMREKEPLTVLFIDIDHFRIFNDQYGHESGDVALQAVANTLLRICQRPLDFICRWGGEEFVAVLPHTNEKAAAKLAQDMLQAMRALQLHVANHAAPKLTISIGHISRTITIETLDEDLVDAADQAMLQAKHLGRNQSFMAKDSFLQRDTHMTCDIANNL